MTVYWAKPTLDDIAAQRAMLERGEEKRRAAKQAEERERLRDTFAAAALTGLIASREWPIDSEEAAHYCYRISDEMLRERERHHIPDAGNMVENTTNHDAVPEARATTAPLNKGAACNTATSGTGNTQKPSAWARFYPNGGPMSVFLDRPPADAEPLYRSPTLTDAEREAIEWCANFPDGIHADTLRSLLERLHT